MRKKRIGAAAMGLAAGIIVSACSIHWSEQANMEECAIQQANLSAPLPAPGANMPSDQFQRFLHDHPGNCQNDLSSDQIISSLTGGALIGLIIYIFGLLLGKFVRWATR